MVGLEYVGTYGQIYTLLTQDEAAALAAELADHAGADPAEVDATDAADRTHDEHVDRDMEVRDA